MKAKITIYDIKRLTAETAPYFFDKKTMRFFGQTMAGFKMKKQPDGRIKISQVMHAAPGEPKPITVRYFNPINNELERE